MAAPLVFRVSGGGELCAGGAELVLWDGVFCCFEHPLTITNAVRDKNRIDRDTISLILSDYSVKGFLVSRHYFD